MRHLTLIDGVAFFVMERKAASYRKARNTPEKLHEARIFVMPMNPLARATLCSLLLSLPLAAQGFDVLVFSKTNVFRHDSIAAGITAILELGLAHSFGVTATEDATQFNATNLALYDAVIFLNTTGNILNTDQETAFQAFIRNGGGFVGIHAAADTEYAWPWYGQLLGAHFASHPATQSGTLQVLDRAHPSTRDLPQKWTRTDEWYNFQASPRGNVHVLATLDETTYSGGTMGPDHPIAWCQEFEGGRS